MVTLSDIIEEQNKINEIATKVSKKTKEIFNQLVENLICKLKESNINDYTRTSEGFFTFQIYNDTFTLKQSDYVSILNMGIENIDGRKHYTGRIFIEYEINDTYEMNDTIGDIFVDINGNIIWVNTNKWKTNFIESYDIFNDVNLFIDKVLFWIIDKKIKEERLMWAKVDKNHRVSLKKVGETNDQSR